MRTELMKRFGFGRSPKELTGGGAAYRQFQVEDENDGKKVMFYQPSETLRGSDHFGLFRANVLKATNLDPARFVRPKDFFDVSPASDDLNFYFTEEFESTSLASKIAETDLELNVANDLLLQVLTAIAELHEQDYLHLNLNPSTISVRGATARVGGLWYMQNIGNVQFVPSNPVCGAPETQSHDRKQIGRQTDLYAFGMVAMWVFLGREGRARQFQGLERDQEWSLKNTTPGEWPRLDLVLPEFPPRLAALVQRLLTKDPTHRMKTAGEALQSLKEISSIYGSSGGVGPRHHHGPTPDVKERQEKPWLLRIGAGVAGVSLVAALGWFFFVPNRPDADLDSRLGIVLAAYEAMEGSKGQNGKPPTPGSASTLTEDTATRKALKAAGEGYMAARQAVYIDLKARAEAEPLVGMAEKKLVAARAALDADRAALAALADTTAARREAAAKLVPEGNTEIFDLTRRVQAGAAAFGKPDYAAAATEFAAASAAADRIVETQTPLRDAAQRSRDRFVQSRAAAASLFGPAGSQLAIVKPLEDRAEQVFAARLWLAATADFTGASGQLTKIRKETFAAALDDVEGKIRGLRARGIYTVPADPATTVTLRRITEGVAAAVTMADSGGPEDGVRTLETLRPLIAEATSALQAQERILAEARARTLRAREVAIRIGGGQQQEFADAERLARTAEDQERAPNLATAIAGWTRASVLYESVEPAMVAVFDRRRAAADALRKVASNAKAEHTPSFILGVKELADAALLIRERKVAAAIDAVSRADDAFRKAPVEFAEARAAVNRAEAQYQEALSTAQGVGATAQGVGAEQHTDFAATQQAARRAAETDNPYEALAGYSRALAGLKQTIAAVASLKPDAEREFAVLKAARAELESMGAKKLPEFADSEARFVTLVSTINGSAFGRALDQARNLRASYDDMKVALSTPKPIDCNAGGSALTMSRIVAGTYDIGEITAGANYQRWIAPFAERGNAPLSFETDFCIQTTQVTQRQFKLYLNTLSAAERNVLPERLRDLRESDEPLRGVRFVWARAYVEWLSKTTGVSLSLPSSDELLARQVALRRRPAGGSSVVLDRTEEQDWTNQGCTTGRDPKRLWIGRPSNARDVEAGCSFDWAEGSQGLRVVLRQERQ